MLELLAWLLAAGPMAALGIYSLEVLLGLRPLPEARSTVSPHNAAVLIPAHDEAPIIGETVRRLLSSESRGLDVVVVADNCSDATAGVARKAGATVLERSDPANRGKGFALAFGRDHLSADPPDVVVVIDADCSTDSRSLDLLRSCALSLNAPVQARNLLNAPPNAAPIVQISNFAMIVKNLVRARGLYRWGGGIPLFGTGMAFPWAIFAQAPLASPETVEDLRLSLDLARQGVAVHLIESARVTSASAAAADTVAQRRRWEQGFVRTAARHAVPLLSSGVAHLSRHRVALGMHLLVPPLAFLMLVGSITLIVMVVAGVATGYWAPAFAVTAFLAAAITVTILAWWREGRSALSAGSLARTPFYVLQKIPIYLGLFTSRRASWNRTPRNDDRR
jgi:cellulose synthase/poly-beta-1,6-N-acetylglucosamine synthase-like glycosyltransferase